MSSARPFQAIADRLDDWLRRSSLAGRAEFRESLNELRARTGREEISVSAVDHWFAGRKCPRGRHLLDIVQVFGRSSRERRDLLLLAAQLDGVFEHAQREPGDDDQGDISGTDEAAGAA